MTTHAPSSRIPVSALLVIRNEEPLISRALKSCADLVAEIVVIHDGPCSDRSLELCQRYTNKIFLREYVGEAEPHRVFGLEQCHFPWILQLDADEFLSPNLRRHLPTLVVDNKYDGYEFLWPTWYKSHYYYAYYKLALWRKDRFYFIGAPHEYPKAIDAGVRLKRVQYVLDHKPLYDNLTWRIFRSKWIPWTRIHAQYYLRDFSVLAKYNCPLTDWEPRLKYRLRHPWLAGMIGSALAQIALGLYYSLRHRQPIFLKSGLLMAFYHAYVFTYVGKHKT